MNKQAIWVIIVLMILAVLGVFFLQMDLIRTAIKENERRFDASVQEALNFVSNELIKKEELEAFNFSMNGFAIRSRNIKHQVDDLLTLPSILLDLQNSPLNNKKNASLFGSKDNVRYCAKCMKEHRLSALDARGILTDYPQGMKSIPLSERIRIKELNTLLKQAFTASGINTDYKYWVYARNNENRLKLIIHNGAFTIEEEYPQLLATGQSILPKGAEVDLFYNEVPSPGKLIVSFPSKRSFVWRSVLLNFLGSILLVLIIVGCFWYTINVIIKQKKLSEMKTDFINNMTHEFKTPIATISLAADSIASPMIANDPNKVKRFTNIIKQENKRMNKQVEKVLQMARLDKEEFGLKRISVNLHEVIENAIRNINLQVEKKEGKAYAVLEAKQSVVEGDLTHISNIMNNLLDNANKYSPDKPDISITTRNVKDGVEVIVKDNGIGMSKEARKHIFDKFYRVHTGNLHDVKGFGLGLSYVKAMMIAHKGKIDVKSELGKGSSFILHFPFKVN